MKNSENPYQTEVLKKGECKEQWVYSSAPIIDIIRHGSTQYKEDAVSNQFKFDPTHKKFALDSQHLDLTDKGIQEINQTAEQLIKLIDKENEVILLATSPKDRAYSSMLLIEQRLEQAGINILNPQKFLVAKNLRSIDFKDEAAKRDFIQEFQEYLKGNPETYNERPEKTHINTAARLNKEILDLFAEDYNKIDLRFNRFLRHMTNIDSYFTDKTKKILKDKRLRIICLSHAETPDRFIQQVLRTDQDFKRGQILEIRPAAGLDAGGQNENQVILYSKGPTAKTGQATVRRRFMA